MVLLLARQHQHGIITWLKSVSHEKIVAKHDVAEPLAVWRGLNKERHFIEEHFTEYDTDGSNTLHQDQLERILTDLNDGKPPLPEEVQWVLAYAVQTGAVSQGYASDAATSKSPASTHRAEEAEAHSSTGKGSVSIEVTKDQLGAAVALWFHHVSPLRVRPKVGCLKVAPYIYTGVAAIASCAVVAATTVLFSEEKTIEWLIAVMLSQVWKNLIIEPLKALMCGRTFEFLFGLLLGDCMVQDAALNVLQDGLEGAAEDFGENLPSAALGVDDVVEDMVANGDDVGGVVATTAVDAGRGGGVEDKESEARP